MALQSQEWIDLTEELERHSRNRHLWIANATRRYWNPRSGFSLSAVVESPHVRVRRKRMKMEQTPKILRIGTDTKEASMRQYWMELHKRVQSLNGWGLPAVCRFTPIYFLFWTVDLAKRKVQWGRWLHCRSVLAKHDCRSSVRPMGSNKVQL